VSPTPTTPRRIRRLAALLLIALTAAAAVAAGASAEEIAPAEPIPVLGSKSFATPYGAGFGKAEPEVIFNGGDPSGEVSEIHWTGWGNPIVIGYGKNPIFKPHGGYYRKPARVELRATELGKCGPRAAYTRLELRVPKHPGGELGKWQLWSGVKTICEPPH
jgi:hypothetical protein